MFCRALIVITVLFAFIFGVAASDDGGPTIAKVNLDGKAYMGFMPINNNGRPDPNGEYLFPLYAIVGQEGDKIYGSLIMPYLAESGSLPPAFGFELESNSLCDGVVKGKKVTLNMVDPVTRQVTDTMILKVQSNGAIKTKVTGVQDKKVKVKLYPCYGENKRLNGQYIGNIWLEGFSAPDSAYNAAMGVLVQGENMTFTYVFYDPSAGQDAFFGSGVAAFDPATNTFSYQEETEDGTVTVTGSIANGVMNLSLRFPVGVSGKIGPAQLYVNASATLFQFGDNKWKKPRLEAVTPKKVSAGSEQIVNIIHRDVVPGSLIRISKFTGGKTGTQPAVYIKGFYTRANDFVVKLQIADGASGKVYFKVDNPNGKKSSGKKPLIIQ